MRPSVSSTVCRRRARWAGIGDAGVRASLSRVLEVFGSARSGRAGARELVAAPSASLQEPLSRQQELAAGLEQLAAVVELALREREPSEPLF